VLDAVRNRASESAANRDMWAETGFVPGGRTTARPSATKEALVLSEIGTTLGSTPAVVTCQAKTDGQHDIVLDVARNRAIAQRKRHVGRNGVLTRRRNNRTAERKQASAGAERDRNDAEKHSGSSYLSGKN
jgi:hypothetical protein